MSRTTACLLCGSQAAARHTDFPGYREPERFSVFHCSNCGTAFSLPRISPSSIYENIYDNASEVPGYNRYMLYARHIRKLKDPLRFLADSSEPYWGVREALRDAVQEQPRILEVGSGLGYLTYSLVRSGYDATGIDISESAVTQARERFGDHFICTDIDKYALTHAGTFDVVVSTEVIEHIGEPLTFLSSVLALLRPGGMAVLTTPNKSFYPDDTVWASDLPPVHQWWFSEASMKYMGERLSAKVRFVDYSSFYRENFKAVSVKGGLPVPFFNEGGDLIAPASKNEFKIKMRIVMSSNPVTAALLKFLNRNIRLLAGTIRMKGRKELRACGSRGLILCAILEKR